MDQHLSVFVKVVQLKSFSKAAEELHMTQPAVSQYILSLERTIGAKLLDRSNKFVRLNRAGEIVYHHAVEILGMYQRMNDLVRDLSETASGKLSIGASYTFGEYVLPHIISRLRKSYPNIHPSISIGNTKEIFERVEARRLDVGIVEGTFDRKRLYSECLAKDRMYIYAFANHPAVGKQHIQLSDLREETWIVREVGSGTREAVERMFESYKMQPLHRLEFGSTQIVKESVEAGLGITLLSEWAVKKELSLGTLCTIPVIGMPMERQFSIITQTTSFRTKAMDVFWELARESVE